MDRADARHRKCHNFAVGIHAKLQLEIGKLKPQMANQGSCRSLKASNSCVIVCTSTKHTKPELTQVPWHMQIRPFPRCDWAA